VLVLVMVAGAATALRRRPAYVGNNARYPVRLRRRERMVQQFSAHDFASAERMERERFFAETQGPLQVERGQWTRRAEAAQQLVEKMGNRLPTSPLLRLLIAVAGAAGTAALIATGDLVDDTVRALDVEARTAVVTTAGVLLLLLCLGAVLGESLQPTVPAIVGVPLSAAATCLAVIGITIVIAQIAPAGPDARFSDALARAGASCQAAGDNSEAAAVMCAERNHLAGALRRARNEIRVRALVLPLVATVGASGLVRSIFLAATFAASRRLRRLRRQVTAVDRRILLERAHYQADVAAAAEQAGVAPQVIAAAAQAA
jgi:hypothetical protein